jgi:hypothetical protein
MSADPGFGELGTDPAVQAVVRALDGVLAGRGIDLRENE